MEASVPAEALVTSVNMEPPAKIETFPNGENKLNERAIQLEGDFGKVSEAYAKIRADSRVAQIGGLRADGAKPFKVFTQIAGEYSRADNIFCGINGEADHKVVSQYLREEATGADGDMKDVLSWLAAKGDELAGHRGIVKGFLILDQLTDPKNYEDGRIVDEDTGFFNSSLGDIDSRVLPDAARSGIVNKISETRGTIASWKDEREKYASMGKDLMSFINPRNPESVSPIVENGTRSDGPGQKWREAADSAEDWTQSTSGVIGEGDPQKIGGTMLEYMDKLTGAQAILESQYYHVGVGLLRAAANGSLPEECRSVIKADLVKAAVPIAAA